MRHTSNNRRQTPLLLALAVLGVAAFLSLTVVGLVAIFWFVPKPEAKSIRPDDAQPVQQRADPLLPLLVKQDVRQLIACDPW